MKKTIFLITFILIHTHINAQKKSAQDYFYEANGILKIDEPDSATTKKSIKLYSKALSINPKHWASLRNRARGYMFLKKYDDAIIDLNKAIKIISYEKHPELIEMRGECFYEKKKYQNAINDFNIYLPLIGDKSYVLMSIAKAYWKLGNKEKACLSYKKAVKENPNIEPKNSFLKCG
jgi:tetratricopeptide (TPR) repeat protein